MNAFEQRQSITEDFVKQVQEVLTVNTYDSRRYQLGERPGQYKVGDYVTGRNEVGALSEDVHAEMSELLEDISDVDNADALVAAAYFHAKFENIHPFFDGNGRTGRLLMNYFLLLHDHPPIIIHEEDRKAYYKALLASYVEDEDAFKAAARDTAWYKNLQAHQAQKHRALNDQIQKAEGEKIPYAMKGKTCQTYNR